MITETCRCSSQWQILVKYWPSQTREQLQIWQGSCGIFLVETSKFALTAGPGPDFDGGVHQVYVAWSVRLSGSRCRITSGDTVQLVEESLDGNLLNNAVKIKFTHCSVLPGGVSIQETLNNVIILICTNQSVHRVLLPHPARMYRTVSTIRASAPSTNSRDGL